MTDDDLVRKFYREVRTMACRHSVVFLVVALFALAPAAGLATSIDGERAEGLQIVPIANIQDSSSYYDGRIVTIRGVVTIGAGVLDDLYTRAYVQDESGRGINVFDFDMVTELVRGRLVEVTGEIDDYLASGASYPTTEIKDVTVTVVQSGQVLPDPVLLTTSAASDPEWDGTWIEVSGVMVEPPYYAGGGYNVNLDDGSGQITVRIWDTTGIDVSGFAQGDTVTAIGAGSVYMATFQILTGYQEDIWEGPPDITGPPVIADTDHQPASPLYTEPVVVTSHVTDDGSVSSVSLFYSTDGGSSWQSTAMADDGVAPDQTAGDDVYTAQIGPQVEGTTVDYYIQAIDNEALESFDPTNAPASTYSYIVSGGPSGDGTGTATITPDSVGLSQTVSETITITGDGANTLASVALVVPEDWSWSQNASDVELGGQGFYGAGLQVIGDSIVITGAGVTDINVGQVIIADLTSPPTATTSTFAVKTAVAGGQLTDIASPPTVKVGSAGPEFIPIADIQANPAQYQGQIVTIRGVVTIGAGVLDDNYTRAYVQDESGRGINVFDYDMVTELVRGRLVEVTGEIDDYLASGASYPTTEIKDVTVTVVQSGQALPDPVFVTTSAASDPEWDGTWIEVSGVMVEPPYYAGGGYNVNLDDGSGQITVRIWDTTGIDVSGFAQGDTVTAIGAGSVYMATFQILTGYQEDIWEGPPDITGPPVIADTDHQPASPLYTEPVVVTSRVTDDGSVSSVSLFYSTDGGSSWQSTAMADDGVAPDQTAGDDVYTGQIGPQAEGTTVDYYIQAVDNEALESFDPTNAPASTYSYTVRAGMPGDGSGTASIWPDSVDISQAVTETLTVVGDGSNTLLSVAIIVPQNWNWSAHASDVSLSGAGFSVATTAVSGDTITVNGAAVTDADIGQVIVAGLTSPGTATTSIFVVKTAVAGGTLAEIASSPQVMVGEEETQYTPIADIQANVGEYEGKVVTIKGVVTIGAGVLDDQYTRAYLQDESGRGINLFDFDIIPTISRGNLVEVTGTIEDYLATGAIDATTEITDVSVTVLDTNQPLPDPVILSTDGAQSGEWDGTWIQVTGVMQEDPYYAGGGYNLNIDDGSGRYTIRIWETTGIDVSEFAEGDTITAIGTGSVYSTSYQMLTGYQEDIFEGQPVTEGIGYASISPSKVKASRKNLTETITIWSDVDCILTDISVVIPMSWTWNRPDTTGVQLSGVGFPEGTSLEISGDRTILIHGAAVCEPGIIAISYLDAPKIGETSTFRIKTAMEGQSLKDIQNSPKVTVEGLKEAVLAIEPRVFVPNRHAFSEDDGFLIEFNVPTNSRVVMRLFDIEGRLVRTLIDEEQYAGPGQAMWNGRDELREVVPVGVYICHLEATDRDEGKTTTDQVPIVVGMPLD